MPPKVLGNKGDCEAATAGSPSRSPLGRLCIDAGVDRPEVRPWLACHPRTCTAAQRRVSCCQPEALRKIAASGEGTNATTNIPWSGNMGSRGGYMWCQLGKAAFQREHTGPCPPHLSLQWKAQRKDRQWDTQQEWLAQAPCLSSMPGHAQLSSGNPTWPSA